jgi:uncharacterized lipoprotein YehR (DUF1307 family)
MKHNKWFTLLAVALVLSLTLTACGGSKASSFPTGRFIQSGSQEYGMTFNADGTFSVGNSATVFVTGTYKADNKVFTETSNSGGCKTNVSFNYAFDGTNLTFTYVGNPEDDADCTGRYADFNNVTYTLKK